MRIRYFSYIAVFILIFAIVYNIVYYTSAEIVTIKVTDKDRITTGSGEDLSSKYLVFAEGETFENVDETFMGKWNSSDVQGKLLKDSTYSVKVIGWRFPFLSTYRNIIEVY